MFVLLFVGKALHPTPRAYSAWDFPQALSLAALRRRVAEPALAPELAAKAKSEAQAQGRRGGLGLWWGGPAKHSKPLMVLGFEVWGLVSVCLVFQLFPFFLLSSQEDLEAT